MTSHPTHWLAWFWRNDWLVHVLRTAAAAMASFAIAQLFDLPEAYWACISTLVVMQSTVGTAWSASWRRLLGTALGAGLGGVAGSYLEPGVVVFGGGVFLLGLICFVLHQDLLAYRFASITFIMVMAITREGEPFVIAAHRFIEVSIGIAVALALTWVWPGRPEATPGGERQPSVPQGAGKP